MSIFYGGMFHDLAKGWGVSIFDTPVEVLWIYEDSVLTYGLVLHRDIEL